MGSILHTVRLSLILGLAGVCLATICPSKCCKGMSLHPRTRRETLPCPNICDCAGQEQPETSLTSSLPSLKPSSTQRNIGLHIKGSNADSEPKKSLLESRLFNLTATWGSGFGVGGCPPPSFKNKEGKCVGYTSDRIVPEGRELVPNAVIRRKREPVGQVSNCNEPYVWTAAGCVHPSGTEPPEKCGWWFC